jgi:hypothetical protein
MSILKEEVAILLAVALSITKKLHLLPFGPKKDHTTALAVAQVEM